LSALVFRIYARYKDGNASLKQSRKQVAVQLLSQHRFEPIWHNSLRVVAAAARDPATNWSLLSRSDEESLCTATKNVLNYLEFIAICVNSGVADRKLVEWSLGWHYTHMCRELRTFIVETRVRRKDPDIWINLTKLQKQMTPQRPSAVARPDAR